MREKSSKSPTEILESFLNNAEAKPAYKISGNPDKTIFSINGVFNEELYLDMIECLFLKTFNSLVGKYKTEISNGNLTKDGAKKAINQVCLSIKDCIENYKIKTGESSCPYYYKDDLEQEPILANNKGINVQDLESKVHGIIPKIEAHLEEAHLQFTNQAFNVGKASVFSLNDRVSDDEIREIFKLLQSYKYEIISGNQDDFVKVMRGKGESKHKIGFLKPAILLSLINYTMCKGWFVSRDVKSYWKYVAANFKSIDGEIWDPAYLNSNLGRSNSKEIRALFKI